MTLFDAALQAWKNLSTVMDLKSHPASCLCYGCNLQRAVIEEAMRRAWENTRQIREREAEAEHPSQGLMEMRLDTAGFESLLTEFSHTRGCPILNPMSEEFCTCGLEWRIRLRTEMEMHNAWQKRAEEVEKKLQNVAPIECALRLFSASSALGLSEKNSIVSACDKLREISGVK